MEISDALSNATIKSNITAKVNPSVDSNPDASASNDLMVAFFKMRPEDITQGVNEKLSDIYDWASEKGESEVDILNILKDVKYRLGAPSLGMTDLEHVHTYIKLRSQAERSELKAKLMEQ